MDSIEEQEQRNWTQGEPIHLHFGTESSMGRGPGTGDCICAFTPGARAHGRQRWPCGDEERVYQQSLREGHCLQKRVWRPAFIHDTAENGPEYIKKTIHAHDESVHVHSDRIFTETVSKADAVE
mmetsp:Transcript_8619/g.17465  ORF Transcript_8619/g.17465 Transcript_8619/m.17465 type:complete len:124 (-) Transcript_8619:514-885(-)